MAKTALIRFAATALVANSAFAQNVTPEPSGVAEAYPIVLTPTRLRQSLQDVPASVTIITADTMAKFGITSVPEALRLVPGMEVTQATGSDYRINYHGTNILSPRRMNVLIDGVSAYQPAFARVEWKSLPVSIEDIDRIEVTRGPNSASYGPNSMLAVINIITRHPADVERGFIATSFGSLGTTAATGRVALALGNTSMRLTLSKDQDSGYDFLSRVVDGHDSTSLDRLGFRSDTKFDSSLRLDVGAGYVGGTRQVGFAERFQASLPDQKVTNFFVSPTLTKTFSPNHELKVQGSFWSDRIKQEWTTCPPTGLLVPELFALYQANPDYANTIAAGRRPSGGSASDNALAAAALAAIARLGPRALQPTCGTINQNLTERRSEIEVQDTLVLSEQLRVVSGLGVRNQYGNSETYLAGSVSNSTWWVFANGEYKLRTWLSFNTGGYVEHDGLSGDTTFSPRLAANIRLSGNQALRFVWSGGTRTPDIQEQRANWSYAANNATPPLNGSPFARFYQSAFSPGGLSSERIDSREIGYLLNQPALGLLLDVKVFDDRLHDLISEKLQLQSYQPTNTGSVRLRGAELQTNLELSPGLSAFANYSLLRNRAPSSLSEQTQYSKSSGSVGISSRFDDGWAWSLAYYGASGDGIFQNSYGREDLTLSKSLKLSDARVTTTFTVRRLDNKSVSYARDTGTSLVSGYNNRLQAYGYVKVSF